MLLNYVQRRVTLEYYSQRTEASFLLKVSGLSMWIPKIAEIVVKKMKNDSGFDFFINKSNFGGGKGSVINC